MRMILSDVQMRQLEKIIGMSNMCPDVLTFRAVPNYLSKRKFPLKDTMDLNTWRMAAIQKFSCRSSPRTTFADCLFSFTPVSIKLYGLNGLKNLITVTIYKI